MAENKDQRTIEIIVNGQKANASLKEMNAAAAVLYNQFQKVSADDPGRARLLADYRAMKDRIGEVKTELGGVTQSTGLMKQAFANVFALVTAGGVMGLINQVIGLGKAIFDTTAKFETYEVVMTNALGNKSKAQQAMSDIQAMAAQTPFSVDELTGSFIKFVNRGLNPSMTEMTKLADIAASQGKSFDQLTEAVLDAGTGEFERLKEFGIKASKSGDQVSLSFKGITQSVKNTPEAINGAIMAFGGMQGVAGSTAAISKTLEGRLSNLGDTSDQLKIKIGQGLKPVFTLILGAAGDLLGWVGRFLEEAKPLTTLFVEIAKEVRQLYSEVADILEGFGLFSEKTDTVKLVIEALRVAITILLIPIRALVLAARGLNDGFIDLYNRSGLLRGVLGGLGAVVVSVFTTIKDAAINILGGVGDILIGVFTLDKDKIISGFKRALEATADVALSSGQRAADDFMKGYEASKDKRITRRVDVNVTTAESGEFVPAGEKLKSDKGASDAATDKKAAVEAKNRQKQLEDAAKAELQLQRSIEDMRVALMLDANEREIAEINLHTNRKMADLKGTEQQITEQWELLEQERQDKINAVRARQRAEAEAQRAEDAAREEEQIAADEELYLANLELKVANGLEAEQAYQDAVYELKKAALERQLELLVEAGKGETAEAKRLKSVLLKVESDHVKSVKKNEQDQQNFKKAMAGEGRALLSDTLSFLIDNLDQQTAAYGFFKAAMKTLQLAEIGIRLEGELASNAKVAAELALLLGPVAGPPAAAAQLAVRNGFSIGRAALSAVKIAAFDKGGATGDGMLAAGQVLDFSRMRVGSNGRLVDESGFAVAGLVHEDEYVIPKWLRQDPQVAAFENWVEAKRQRGFFEGGPTSPGSPAAAPEVGFRGNGPSTAAVLSEMVGVLRSLDSRLQGVETWQKSLRVVNSLQETNAGLDELKQVKHESAIRRK